MAIIVSTKQNHQSKAPETSALSDIVKIFASHSAQEREIAWDTAQILQLLDTEHSTVIAGYLLGLAEISPATMDHAGLLCGKHTIDQFLNAQRIRKFSELSLNNTAGTFNKIHVEENLRKMLIAMVDDVGVVLICLANQLSILRNCRHKPSNQQKYQAALTTEIYAPLANRLGVWNLKWELEDFAFRYVNPESYQGLAGAIDEKRALREGYIADLVRDLGDTLQQNGISAEVYGRPKHIFSIWKKMQRKGLEFGQVWDVRAVRIVVDSVEHCYRALSLAHGQWDHFPGEFEDYIATPKLNGYRSIHTVVKGPGDKSVEIQIRTAEMHEDSELGFAAHWRYKESVHQDSSIDRKVIWLRQLLDWKEQILAAGTASVSKEMASVPDRVQDDRVYVFTPKGTVIDLPRGATPIDFAYAIHTEVGHRTRGAMVNSKMKPLHHVLETGDQVQIQTVKQGGPSLDWLKNTPPYARTSRARNRISQWHKHMEYDQHVSEGRGLLERELNRLGLEDLGYDNINQHTHFHKVDDMLAAIGSGDYKLSKALYPFRKKTEEGLDRLVTHRIPGQGIGKRASAAFTVQGVGNLLTHLASCCVPVPGEQIKGYITSGRGVSIHRSQCVNILNIDEDHQDRIIDVEWGIDTPASYAIGLQVTAYHRSGLLHDITEILKSSKADVLKVNMETDAEHITRIMLRLDIQGDIRPEDMVSRLLSVQNVFEVKRAG